jgi:hypothetical protein
MVITRDRLERLATLWIFPGLVAAMVCGNQGWKMGPVLLGQSISWINDAAALTIVLLRFRNRRWPLVLLAFILLSKAVSIVPAFHDRGDLAFDAGLCLLFCAAGAVIVSRRPGIVYRQAVAVALLSLPLMLLQITGVAPWSEALNTENIATAGRPVPTLFVHEDDLRYRTSQARPSGFTHSNNFISLLAGFVLALHFSRIKTPFLTRRDLVVCTFAVLTMAKIVMLTYSVIVAWKLITGVRMERLRMVNVLGWTAFVLGAYAVLFPGLFTSNISVYKVSYSFFIRANDFADLLPGDSPVKLWLARQLAGTPRANWEGAVSLSGYAQIIAVLPYVLIAGALIAPIFYKGVRRVRRRYPELVDLTVLTLFVVVLYPTAVPFFRAQIFWFMGGFALLPLFTVFEPTKFLGAVSSMLPPGSRWNSAQEPAP